MTKEELEEILDWAARRDAKLCAWLRHLILLGAGSLSILVSLQPVHSGTGLATVFQKGAWVSLGLGILLGSVRLYADVWREKIKVKRLATMRREKPAIDGVSQNEPISVKLPAIFQFSEYACYLSLIAAVIALVCFGLVQ